MSQLQTFDPIGQRFNKFLQNFLRNDMPDFMRTEQMLDMKIDLSQDAANYIVRADMPGVNKEDIKVDVDGNLVTISAETKKQKEEKKGETVVYSERYQGQIYRSFRLDGAVDEAKAHASYHDGVLELTLPKKDSGSSKRINVA